MPWQVIRAVQTYSWINTQGSICRSAELRAHLFYIMINSVIDSVSEMFVTFSGFSCSLTAVINHGWHLLLHINVLKFHHWVLHSDWCSRLSPYPPHHSPAEYEMTRRSSSQTHRELYQWTLFSLRLNERQWWAWVHISNKCIFSPAILSSRSCSNSFRVALLLSHYIVCSSFFPISIFSRHNYSGYCSDCFITSTFFIFQLCTLSLSQLSHINFATRQTKFN